jgi:acetoacetyl-CoA synthetase
MAGESGLGALAASCSVATPAGDPDALWRACWRDARLLASGHDRRVRDERGHFFPDLKLNYAENLLAGGGQPDDVIAVTACHADGSMARVSRGELRRQVAGLAQALRAAGLAEGDRVAIIPRSDARAVVAVLAVAAIGASLAIASPEMSAALMAARFKPLAPRLLLAHAGTMPHDAGQSLATRVAQVVEALPQLEAVIVLDDAASRLPSLAVPAIDLSTALADMARDGADEPQVLWPRFPFHQPLFVTRTAGADGQLESLVHGAGGVLLEHLKEQRLQMGVVARSRMFAPASVASALWLWQLSSLAIGAGIVLYDGPVRDARTLWRIAEEGEATDFVAHASYLRLGEHAGLAPGREFGLQALQSLFYTGVTLDEVASRWVREKVKPIPLQALCLSPDLLGCLLLQRANLPLDDADNHSLGLGVRVADRGVGLEGELVCDAQFPSRPLGFLDDPQGTRFHDTYLKRTPGAWSSGERVERGADGALLQRGRVDGLMNVRGALVAPAELLPLLREFSEIRESAVVEQQQCGELGEGRAILLVALREGASLDGGLIARMRRRFTEAASPAHVPDLVLEVRELPRLADGSVCIAALRDVVNDRPVADIRRLLNPGSLRALRGDPALQSPGVPPGRLPPPPAPGWRSRQDHEAYLQALWEKIFGFSPIGLDDDFFEIGGHSLLAARIFSDIQLSTEQRLAPSTLLKAPTIRQLAAVMDQAAWDLPVPLVQLRPGHGRPFFLVHSLAGTFLELWAVLRALDTQRAVYGLQARAVGDENAPYVSVREMATDYIGHMRRVQPTGPYAVGGYSFGGLVAYEIAQQLSRAGEQVELVTLIDTHVHGRYLPLWEWVRYCTGWLGVTLGRLRSLPLRGQLDYLRKKALVLNDRGRVALGLSPKHPELVGDVLREANLPPALRRTRGAMLVALREYRPEPYSGRVVFLRASRPAPGDPLPVWRKVARGGLEIDVTPGDHDEMISGANAKALAVALARHL